MAKAQDGGIFHSIVSIVARVTGDAESMGDAVREAVWAVAGTSRCGKGRSMAALREFDLASRLRRPRAIRIPISRPLLTFLGVSVRVTLGECPLTPSPPTEHGRNSAVPHPGWSSRRSAAHQEGSKSSGGARMRSLRRAPSLGPVPGAPIA